MNFTPDRALDYEAQMYSESAIQMARGAFGRELDYSEKSIEDVEFMLSAIHADTQERHVDDEKIRSVAVSVGYYIGEVFRRKYGAEWGWVGSDAERFVGMRASGTEVLFWPGGKALGRINNGFEDHIMVYYNGLVRETRKNVPVVSELPGQRESRSTTANQSRERKPSWIRRLFGA